MVECYQVFQEESTVRLNVSYKTCECRYPLHRRRLLLGVFVDSVAESEVLFFGCHLISLQAFPRQTFQWTKRFSLHLFRVCSIANVERRELRTRRGIGSKILVLFLFLFNLRTAAISCTAIPLSFSPPWRIQDRETEILSIAPFPGFEGIRRHRDSPRGNRPSEQAAASGSGFEISGSIESRNRNGPQAKPERSCLDCRAILFGGRQ